MNTLVNDRQRIGALSLDDLADHMASVGVGSQNDQVARAEFLRRQTLAAGEAAKAAEETAAYTRRNAHYILLSVVVLAVSSIATLIVTAAKK
jgi:hypothetical protein